MPSPGAGRVEPRLSAPVNASSHLTGAPVLDDLDRALILAVYRYRRAHGKGPKWRWLRAEVGLPRPSLSTKAFLAWLEAQPPDAYASATRARRAFNRTVTDADPLPRRLYRLRRAGFLAFATTEGSLDVGPVVRDRKRPAMATAAD